MRFTRLTIAFAIGQITLSAPGPVPPNPLPVLPTARSM